MGVVEIVLRKTSVYSLRKKYDKIREKADRDPDYNKKITVLRALDQVEPTLVALEEQILSGFERKRMMKYVHQNLKKAEHMVKDEDYSYIGQQQKKMM